MEPEDRQGTFNLAYAHLHGDTEEDWSSGVRLFRRILEIDPGYTEALHHLSTAYWNLGDGPRAAEADRRYVESPDVNPELGQRSSERLAAASAN